MNKQAIPYLCGGTFFTLILEARKPRRKARERYDGGSDGLNAPDVMIGLINVVDKDGFPSDDGKVIKKVTTQFKTCQNYGGTYIPFKEDAFISTFNSAFNQKAPDLLERMSGFVYKYISDSRMVWLVKALMDTILKDEGIQDNKPFNVSEIDSVTKKELTNVTEVNLPIFLLSVFHYIVNERKDNTQGYATFDTWHKQAKRGVEREFSSNIGEGITWTITVQVDRNENTTTAAKNMQQSPKHLTLPARRPQENITYSEEDKILLEEFTSDYDEIMLTMIREDYANYLIDMSLPLKINELYSSKWKAKANDFDDPTLKSQAFSLLGELNMIAGVSFPKPSMVRDARVKIRNLYTYLHPESFDSTAPNDVFIDDWNDGEF